jgi:signal peptidase I
MNPDINPERKADTLAATPPTQSPQTQTQKDSYLDIFKFAIIVLIIFLPIRLWVAKPFIVSGDSMYPTFQNNQYLIVDELTYRLEPPKRDDVIVFEYPYDVYLTSANHTGAKTYYIKRIIGLPGETIESKNGIISIINKDNPQGTVLNEPYVVNHSTAGDFSVTLTNNEYFVMGDNRPASSDSRVWGPLDGNLIVGRPFFRLLPPSAISVLPGGYKGNSAI